MNKALFGIISVGLCVVLLSFVMAAQSENRTAPQGLTVKNMTYGYCVSEHAQVKNECYASVKTIRASCVANTTETAPCMVAYKKDLKQCKSDFKASKQECKKIKHTFFETMRHSFD